MAIAKGRSNMVKKYLHVSVYRTVVQKNTEEKVINYRWPVGGVKGGIVFTRDMSNTRAAWLNVAVAERWDFTLGVL